MTSGCRRGYTEEELSFTPEFRSVIQQVVQQGGNEECRPHAQTDVGEEERGAKDVG